MHRESTTLSTTKNCLVILSYKMKVSNNYPDQDYSNGRLVYMGTARKLCLELDKIRDLCYALHSHKASVSYWPSQSFRKQLQNATNSSQLWTICIFEQNHFLNSLYLKELFCHQGVAIVFTSETRITQQMFWKPSDHRLVGTWLTVNKW